MQINVVDSSFGFVKIRFVTVFGPTLSDPSGNHGRVGAMARNRAGQGQDHEKVQRRRAALQLQMVLALTLALTLP